MPQNTHTPQHKEGMPCPLKPSAHFLGATFLPTQVDVQRRDHLPAQGLPPPHDHVDGALAVEESLDGLLLVLVDEVHIIDPQQPVIDPKEARPAQSTHTLGPEGSLTIPIQEAKCQKQVPPTHTQKDATLQDGQVVQFTHAGG